MGKVSFGKLFVNDTTAVRVAMKPWSWSRKSLSVMNQLMGDGVVDDFAGVFFFAETSVNSNLNRFCPVEVANRPKSVF